MDKLKKCIILKVEKNLPYNLLKNKKKIFRILLGRKNGEQVVSRIEIIFWRPRIYTLVAYRHGFKSISPEKKDDFDIPFTVSENHRTEWKNLRFLDLNYKEDCEILESELIEAKRIGADEKGFYYSRHD